MDPRTFISASAYHKNNALTIQVNIYYCLLAASESIDVVMLLRTWLKIRECAVRQLRVVQTDFIKKNIYTVQHYISTISNMLFCVAAT